MIRKIYYLVIILVFFSSIALGQNFLVSNSITSDTEVRIVEMKRASDGVIVYGDFRGTMNVTGSPLATARDAFLAKYDEDYNLAWFQHIAGAPLEFAYDLVLHDNYIYIVGTYLGSCTFDGGTEVLNSTGSFDAFLAKYNQDGTFVWAKPYAYNNAIQYVTSIDVDNSDDLIIGGYYSDSITFESTKYIETNGMFYSKADTSGTLIWAESIPANNTNTKLQAISAFDDGYYYTGNVEGSATFDIGGITSSDPSYTDVFLYKTDFDGNGSWLRKSYLTGTGDTRTGTITGDEYGNVYFTGLFGGDYIQFDENDVTISSTEHMNDGSLDAFIAKYNKTGDLIWSQDYGQDGEEWARDVKYQNGFLYQVGYFSDTLYLEDDTIDSGAPGDLDAILAMYDAEGNVLRAANLPDANDGIAQGIAITVDNQNNAYWGGTFASSQIDIGDSTYNLSGTQSGFISKYKPTFTTAFTKEQHVTCYSGSDGELIITPYFGVPPFTYDWSHDVGLNDSTATGLTAGIYSVTVTDGVDSVYVRQFNLTEPDSFVFNPTVTDITTCSYDNLGAIDLNVTGGTGAYSYQWFESEGGSGVSLTLEDQNNLTIGRYDVTVTDESMCSLDTTIYITGPSPVIFAGSIVTNDNGIGNGGVTTSISGGTPAYTYLWSSSETVKDISSKVGGDYTITVTDNNSCTFDTTFNIVTTDTLFAFITNQKDDCTGGAGDGTATVSYYTPNPTPVISYAWSSGGTSATETGLLPGKYYVTVTDSDLSETSVDSVTILDLGYTMAGNLSGTTDVDCKGDADGYIDLDITTGGILPYSYNWSNAETTQDIVDLTAGTYSVTVTDDNGCTLELLNYSIGEPAFDLTVPSPTIQQDITCFGYMNGELEADPAGGNGSFTYKWNDPANQTTKRATGLEKGFYTVTVTDFKGCEATGSVNLTQPDSLEVSGLGDLPCYGENTGTIALTINGGTPAYAFNWTTSDGSGLVSTVQNQSGLSAGTYEVLVTDGNLCEAHDTIALVEPSEIQIDTLVTHLNCNGDTDASIDITVTGGTVSADYTYNWTTSDGSGLVVAAGDQTGLSAGTYGLTVTDDNSCTGLISVTIMEPTVINLDNSVDTNPTCNGSSDGSIDITISGGTVATSYTYNWATSDGSGLVAADEDQTGLTAGTYNVTVTDDNACSSSFSRVLDEPAQITIDSENSTDESTSGASDGTVIVTASGGTGSLYYTLTPGGTQNTTGNFTSLSANDYVVNVTDDNSCGPVASNTITVGVGDAIEGIFGDKKVKIYPNPTSDKLFLEIDYNGNSLNVEVLNLSGQIIFNKELNSFENTKEEIDLSEFAKGVYFIVIYNNEFSYKEKILLQ